jgi:hypothetical protein
LALWEQKISHINSDVNDSTEDMYIETSEEEADKMNDKYQMCFVNCKELFSVIEKEFIMEKVNEQ